MDILDDADDAPRCSGEAGAWHSVALEGHQDSADSTSFSRTAHASSLLSQDGTCPGVEIWSQGEIGSWASVLR